MIINKKKQIINKKNVNKIIKIKINFKKIKKNKKNNYKKMQTLINKINAKLFQKQVNKMINIKKKENLVLNYKLSMKQE